MQMLIILGALATLLSFIYWTPKCILINMMEHYYPVIATRSFTTKDPHIALTFDDAPYGSHREIIDRLNTYHMKGTFFIISDYVDESNIRVFVEAVKQGHQLANHGRTSRMHYRLNALQLTDEIEACDQLIKKIYGLAGMEMPKDMFYRPGCGLFHQKMIKLVHNKGYRLALGSVYPNDPYIPSSYINYFYLINHIEKGDVVILHDRNWTPKLLEKLLPWLKSNNLGSVTLATLMAT